MERIVYLVDVVDIPDDSVMAEYYMMARGYLRGYTYNQYAAIQYAKFMNNIFEGRCILDVFQYTIDASENISDDRLVDALLVKHHMDIDAEYNLQPGYELTYIEVYTTGGIEWYCTESLMDYCSDAICSVDLFAEVMFAYCTEVLKYANCPDCVNDLQLIILRIIIPSKQDLLDFGWNSRYSLYSYYAARCGTDGLVYWYITTERFLCG